MHGRFFLYPAIAAYPKRGKKTFCGILVGSARQRKFGDRNQQGQKNKTERAYQFESIRNIGIDAVTQFGKLPYLLKILDVKGMLSIQVHPTKNNAIKEFEDENKGISL